MRNFKVFRRTEDWAATTAIIGGETMGEISRCTFPDLSLCGPGKFFWFMKHNSFPRSLCFLVSINKSQGQSLAIASLYLGEPFFFHGQLHFKRKKKTKNVFCREVLWTIQMSVRSDKFCKGFSPYGLPLFPSIF